jgi:type IV pilus assembly protein PilE
VLGFTLVEVLIVVTIIGILSAIAVPSYRRYVLRVNRTDAKTALTSAAQTLERCYTRNNAYNNPTNVVGCTLAFPFNVPATSARPTYTITGVVNANQFTLTATRINGQVSDTDCGNFQLNELGAQTTVGGTKPAVDCWH